MYYIVKGEDGKVVANCNSAREAKSYGQKVCDSRTGAAVADLEAACSREASNELEHSEREARRKA